MSAVAKKKKPAESDPNPPGGPGKRRYPSREKVKYIAIPAEMHAALEKYALSRSDEDDQKSINWAGRVAIRRFLTQEGLWPPPAP
jgi:hypothetical protein